MDFKTIGIIGKFGSQDIQSSLVELVDILKTLGVKILVGQRTAKRYHGHQFTAASREEIGLNCDLVIVMGGDGTFLSVARDMAPWNKPMLGINLGRLGFLTDIPPDLMRDCLTSIIQGEYQSEVRHLLESRICRKDIEISRGLAMNDVVIHKWEAARMIEFETKINNQFVNIQRSDGMIISTPTGSTAYALSGGGPILEGTIDAILLVSICPHTLSNRPIVIHGDNEVAIQLTTSSDSRAQVTCDGRTNAELEIGDVVHIKKYSHHIKLIHPKGHESFRTLREKLGWSSAPH